VLNLWAGRTVPLPADKPARVTVTYRLIYLISPFSRSPNAQIHWMLAVRTATRCHLNYTAWYFKRADKQSCVLHFVASLQQRHMSAVRCHTARKIVTG